MIKNCQIIFPKGVYRTPPQNAFMNVYFYFYSVVKCGNRALGINERIKKIFSNTKTNPNPPLSRSDRGPSGGPYQKDFEREPPQANDEPVEDTDDKSMISYAAEDNEDTEPMLKKTYQDVLIPLQGELLNTEIVEPTITPIPKQEIKQNDSLS
jgi:hypothetical protein